LSNDTGKPVPLNVFYIIRADEKDCESPIRLPQMLIPQISGYDVFKHPKREVKLFAQINLGDGKAKRFTVSRELQIPPIAGGLDELYQWLGIQDDDEINLPQYDGGGEMVVDFVKGVCTEGELAESRNVLVLAGHGASTSSILLMKLQQHQIFQRITSLCNDKRIKSVDEAFEKHSLKDVFDEDVLKTMANAVVDRPHCVDSEQYLYTRSLADHAKDKISFELVWSFACGMATMEAAYDIRVISKHYVATPCEFTLRGNHRHWVRQLMDSDLLGFELAKSAAECFYWDPEKVNYWDSHVEVNPTVAINLENFCDVRVAMARLCSKLNEWVHGSNWQAAAACIFNAARAHRSVEKSVYDAYGVFQALALTNDVEVPDEIRLLALNVCNAIVRVTAVYGKLRYEHFNEGKTLCNGLAIYLPIDEYGDVISIPSSHSTGGTEAEKKKRSLLMTETDWPSILETVFGGVTSHVASLDVNMSLY